MKIGNLLIILCTIFLWSCANREAITNSLETEVENKTINFKYGLFVDALKEAKKLEKPLLIYFTSDGCGWCLKMEKEVFTDTTLQRVINERFVCSKVHLKRPESVMKTRDYNKLNKSKLDFMKLYNIESAFPTFVIIDFNGKLISKERKYMNVQEFIDFGKVDIQRN